MKPKFIAEVSSNHNHDLDRCLEFIDVSAEIGCDAVKFQLFKLKKLFAPEIIAQNKDIQKRDEWEFPLEFLPALSKRCQEKNIHFSCTPFYLDAVKELLPYVDFYKISSYDLLRDNLLTACAQTKKPVVISTGMATLDEVSHATSLLNRCECKNVTLLHCVSNYPTDPKDCNLAAIETLRTEFDNLVGWSDHTVSRISSGPGWKRGRIRIRALLASRTDEKSNRMCEKRV
jgi:N-acetylneuraminate synthase